MRHPRLHRVPVTADDCVLCGETKECCGFDHDLRGSICFDDFDFVMRAELALINIGCAIPTGSLFDDAFGFTYGGVQ